MESFTEHISRRIVMRLAEESLADLAKELDMSQTTLRRLRDGESEPIPETVQALLPILDTEVTFAYIEEKWPDWAELFRELIEGQCHARNELVKLMAQSTAHVQTIMLCAFPKGVDIPGAVSFVGPEAESVIAELILTDLAYFKDGRYVLRDKNFMLTSTRRIMQTIEYSIPVFDKCGPADRITGFQHYPVNYAGFLEVVRLIRKCISAIKRVCEDPRYKGDRLFFFSLFSGITKEFE